MKARLKEESQSVTRLSDMMTGKFAIFLDGAFEGDIVYRPPSVTGIFAINLTCGIFWRGLPECGNLKVRILQAGEVIEITE